MGSPTFLDCLDCIKSFLNKKLEENIKKKLISESRVLLRVNPSSIFVVLYQRKMDNFMENIRMKTSTMRGTSPMV